MLAVVSRSIVIALSLVVTFPLAAQEQPAPGLKKTPSGYSHEMSKSSFTVPQGWRVEPAEPMVTGKTTLLSVRHGPPPGQSEPAIEVTISWSPLVIKFDDAVEQENLVIGQVYGVDKVTKAEGIQVNEKPGRKITIDNGPTRNGKETGVIYLFEAGPDAANRWKIKVRSTVAKQFKDEHLKMVEALIQNLKW
jgi:hypothetical protein